ncbi:MAG: transglutaminase-like domain-containing protein [Actinomycetota bacterium]
MRLPDRLSAFFVEPGSVPLDEALLWMASLRPGATPEVEAGLAVLDGWAATADDASVAGLRDLVYHRLGFRGDVSDYHRPENSYLDEVLRRRRGMPITLAVVLLSLGRRLGVELEPIGAPGHFLVQERATQRLLDPFDRAGDMDRVEIEARLVALGAQVDLADALAPVSDQAVVARVLNNLTNTMVQRSAADLDWVLDIRLALPLRHQDPRTLAALCEQRGRYGAAADLLELLARATQREDLERRAHALRARLN